MITNANAQTLINDCNDELDRINHLIQGLGTTNSVSNYLTKYALIKCCTTLENVYKTIIADYYEGLAPSLVQYLTQMVRNANRNANLDNIHRFLSEFDHTKKATFKTKLQSLTNSHQLIQEFKDLADARNSLAHGNAMTLSFNDIKNKYDSSVKIMEELDATMI